MTNTDPAPFVCHCQLCEQGLVKIVQCPDCGMFNAICDECEAIWDDPKTPATDATAAAAGQHPRCPHCAHNIGQWNFLGHEAIAAAGYTDCLQGYSA